MGDEGLIPTTDRFGSALSDIVRCEHCGHMQLAPMPSDAELEAAYAAAAGEDYVEEEAGQRETARRTWGERVPCGPCDETGEAERWQGAAANDWRARKARGKAVEA